ncbi:LOW QUALITY PROTEIN: Cupin_1 domain-containing protein [Cephalotus follicularis]|uniref:Cupin_1 domain-containing protein n=1 Tax=Cephalotus follicularis TaxID=3775 RepID=A0A1Q3D243_CEPFO|nr:LOW QUALITY PROTEIN: Cupin_1 domain-containing protein [Cephalotus follicularis]
MAKPLSLALSLCLVLLFNGCLAGRDEYRQQRQNECQLDRLNALEPDSRVEAEAGVTEYWNSNHEQFQCANVAVVRRTIEPNGLTLPFYNNGPMLVYVVQGTGISGTLIPGCPETYQESQQGQQQQQQGRRSQDRHQKVRRFKEGDIIALPAGVAHWCYNDGNKPVVVVSLHDTGNSANQLDRSPREFYLAGNPREEQQLQEQQEQSQQGQRRGDRRQQHQYGRRRGQKQCNNVFCGFEPQMLADAFNLDTNTARKLQNDNDNRGSIVRVRGGDLQGVRPPTEREEEEEEEERRDYDTNGLEETLCSMRLRENLGNPRADIYTPQAGRISTLNSHNLPILRWLQLSAERGVLYNNGVMVPHWNMNAHSIMYVIRGSARVQVVDNYGQSVFDDTVRRGQILTVPQHYAVVKRAEAEGFEWISFKTNDNAMISPLSGRTSAIRAMPEDVLANAFRISRDDARRIKFNVRETTLTSSASRSQRRAEA